METEDIKREQEHPGVEEDLETLLFSEEYDEATDDPAAWLSAIAEELQLEVEAETKAPEEEKESLPQDEDLPQTEEESDPFADRLGIDYVPTVSQIEREKRAFSAAPRGIKPPGQRQNLPIGPLDGQRDGLRRPAQKGSALTEKQMPTDLRGGWAPGPMPMGEAPGPMVLSPRDSSADIRGPSRFGKKLGFTAEDIGSNGMDSVSDRPRTAQAEISMGTTGSAMEASTGEPDGPMSSDPKPTRPLWEDASRTDLREASGPPEHRKREAETQKGGEKTARSRRDEADSKSAGASLRKRREKEAFSSERSPTRRDRAESFRETAPAQGPADRRKPAMDKAPKREPAGGKNAMDTATKRNAAGAKNAMDTAPRREPAGAKNAMDTAPKRDAAGGKTAMDTAPKREVAGGKNAMDTAPKRKSSAGVKNTTDAAPRRGSAGARNALDAFSEGRTRIASGGLGKLSVERAPVSPDAAGRKRQSGLEVASAEKPSGRPEGLDEHAVRARKKGGSLDTERGETDVLSRTRKPTPPCGSVFRERRPGSSFRERRPTGKKTEDTMAISGPTKAGSRMGLDDDNRASRGGRMSMDLGSGKKEK